MWYIKELSLVFLVWSILIYIIKKFNGYKYVWCVYEMLLDIVFRMLFNDYIWVEFNVVILWEENEKSNKFIGLNVFVLV